MLTELVAAGTLPARWVSCDEGYRRSFLDGVAALGLGYMAEVPAIVPAPARGRRPFPRPATPGETATLTSRCSAQLPGFSNTWHSMSVVACGLGPKSTKLKLCR